MISIDPSQQKHSILSYSPVSVMSPFLFPHPFTEECCEPLVLSLLELVVEGSQGANVEFTVVKNIYTDNGCIQYPKASKPGVPK